jgi:penicillin-binding protein 1A
MRIILFKSRNLAEFVSKKLKERYVLVRRRPWVRLLVRLSLATVVLAFYFYSFRYTNDLVDDTGKPLDFDKLARSDFKRSSYIYGSDKKTIGVIFEEVRDPVRIDDIPELLKFGFIAAEDKRFNYNRDFLLIDYPCDLAYSFFYGGADPCAIVRAGLGRIMRIGNLSGASGIRAQFVRLSYADEVNAFKVRDQTFTRKIKEAKIAIQIGRKYPNDEVLEGFFNLIYFGHGVNGLAAAAQRYFGKDIRYDHLTLREIAILVSLNKSPYLYCPIFHKEASETTETVRFVKARERYNWVLGRMLEDGYITQEQYDEASFKEDEPLDIELAKLRPIKDPTFGYSNRIVKEMLLTTGHSESDLSQNTGLRIYTTIDPKIQKITSELFEKHLKLINEGLEIDNRINGAFVIIEVATGNILALSGGNNFDETQYNRVMASRSPGSGFKPFAYATAIDYYGKTFDNCIMNVPFSRRGANGTTWRPQNFREDNPVRPGCIPISQGFTRSVNLATLNMIMSLKDGVESEIKLVNSLGVYGIAGVVKDSDGKVWYKRPGYNENAKGLEHNLPTVIGGSGVNMLELVNAYTVFFRNGIYKPPTLIKEITNSYGDEVLFKAAQSEGKRVISEETASMILAMMRKVTQDGTAKVSMRGIAQPVGCKTGTSNGPKDVSIWCGTPEMVIAFRFGNDNFEKSVEAPAYMRKVSGSSSTQVTGGWIAGILTRQVIDAIYKDRPIVNFPEHVEELDKMLLEKYPN